MQKGEDFETPALFISKKGEDLKPWLNLCLYGKGSKTLAQFISLRTSLFPCLAVHSPPDEDPVLDFKNSGLFSIYVNIK
jgi:hypothetical protein